MFGEREVGLGYRGRGFLLGYSAGSGGSLGFAVDGERCNWELKTAEVTEHLL
jgi:hypothetical protein